MLEKTRDVTIKGPQAYDDHDYKTVSAVRAQVQNTTACADVVCHLQNHLHLFMGVCGGGRGGTLEAISTTLERLLLTSYQTTSRLSALRGPGPGEALQLVHAAREVVLPPGAPSGAPGVGGRYAVYQPPSTGDRLNRRAIGQNPRGLEQSHPCPNTIGPAWRSSCWLATGCWGRLHTGGH